MYLYSSLLSHIPHMLSHTSETCEDIGLPRHRFAVSYNDVQAPPSRARSLRCVPNPQRRESGDSTQARRRC